MNFLDLIISMHNQKIKKLINKRFNLILNILKVTSDELKFIEPKSQENNKTISLEFITNNIKKNDQLL